MFARSARLIFLGRRSGAKRLAGLNSKQFGLIVAAFAIPIAYAAWNLSSTHFGGANPVGYFALFLITLIACVFPVQVGTNGIVLSTNLPVAMACLYLFGPFDACLLPALVSVIMGLRLGSNLRAYAGLKRLFWYLLHNVPQDVTAFGIPSIIYSCGLRKHLYTSHSPMGIACLCITAVAVFYLHAALLTTLVSKVHKIRWDLVWFNTYRWTLTSTVMLSPLGFLMGALTEQSLVIGAAFIVLPLIVARQAYAVRERKLVIYREGVDLLGRLMQEAHPYTHGHLNRVSRWAVRIAVKLDMSPESLAQIENAAILHDIGKIAVDDRILNKVEKLTDDEWKQIKDHPVIGSDIAAQMRFLYHVAKWIRHHHERVDGKGYPDGLAGDEIPIESRIICAVDAYDAMVGGPSKSDQRPYRKPMTVVQAREELARCAGTQFDDRVVSAFLAVLDEEEQEEQLLGHSTVSIPLQLTLVSAEMGSSLAAPREDASHGMKGAA